MNNKRIIAIDVDDTVSITSSTWENVLKDFFSKYFPYLYVNNGKIYNDDDEILSKDSYELQFFKKQNIKINEETWKRYPAINSAQQSIVKLHSMGFKICFITARTDEKYGNAESFTKRWLDYVNIPYDKVFANCQNKGEMCREIGAFVLIDDNPKFLEYALKEGISAIQILNSETPNSRERMATNPQISICENWSDVEKQIVELNSKIESHISEDSEYGI